MSILAAFCILAAAILFIAGLILLALFVLVAGRSLMAIANARTHLTSADEQEETLRSARRAVNDLRQHNENEDEEYETTSDADILDAIAHENAIAARRAARGEEPEEPTDASGDITTMGNEQIEEKPPIPADTFYNREGEEPE